MEEDIDIDTDIDNSWVDSYKAREYNYNEFYNEKVTSIKVFSLYIDTANTVVNVRQALYPLTHDSTISREQLIALIKEKQLAKHDSIKHDSIKHDGIKHDSIKHDSIKHDIIKYKFFSLVRYNINLLPEEIPAFIKGSPNIHDTNATRFLIPETYIRDIHFTDTISIFQDLNALYIIFKEVPNKNRIANKFTQKLKASIKKRYTRHKMK